VAQIDADPGSHQLLDRFFKRHRGTDPQPLVLRAPLEANRVVSAISTELQALMDTNGGKFADARAQLAQRVGVPQSVLLDDHNQERDSSIMAKLRNESDLALIRIADAVEDAGRDGNLTKSLRNRLALDRIANLVVIYAENRGFDNLYGLYPGANGIHEALRRFVPQRVKSSPHCLLRGVA
jgi:phospholipase C